MRIQEKEEEVEWQSPWMQTEMDSSTQVDGEALDVALRSSFTAKEKREEYRYRHRLRKGEY